MLFITVLIIKNSLPTLIRTTRCLINWKSYKIYDFCKRETHCRREIFYNNIINTRLEYYNNNRIGSKKIRNNYLILKSFSIIRFTGELSLRG